MQNLVQPSMISLLVTSFADPDMPGASITITKDPGLATGMSHSEREAMAEEGFAHALRIVNGTIVKDIECESYKVDGNKACSFIIAIKGKNEGLHQLMQVLTISKEKPYVFTYSSPSRSFDTNLPVLEKMLQSFNATGSGNTVT